MRSTVAALVDAVLAAVLCGCVLLGCALADNLGARHACCHKHGMQQCAYNLLERSEKAASAHYASAPPAIVLPEPPVHAGAAAVSSPTFLADSAGLFLRIRVLLI
jgi:hypothetical protein